MERRSRTLIVVTVLALLALSLIAACSQGGGGGSSAPSGSSSDASSTGAGGGQKVVLKDFSFQPANIEVKAGTAVTWENQDSAAHTVTADSGAFSSPQMEQGKTFSFTFDKAGTYKYHCSIHPSMVGQVVVK
jgi:plastocyanin